MRAVHLHTDIHDTVGMRDANVPARRARHYRPGEARRYRGAHRDRHRVRAVRVRIDIMRACTV